MVRTVALASLMVVMADVVLRVEVVSVTILKPRETMPLKVQMVASALLMVRTVALASLMVVMAAVVLMAAVVSITLLKLQLKMQI